MVHRARREQPLQDMPNVTVRLGKMVVALPVAVGRVRKDLHAGADERGINADQPGTAGSVTVLRPKD